MSYQKSAKFINKRLKEISRHLKENPDPMEFILDTMIELGRVAKFRCRSNTAYKNFLIECFHEIAEITEFPVKLSNGRTFTKFKAEVFEPGQIEAEKLDDAERQENFRN